MGRISLCYYVSRNIYIGGGGNSGLMKTNRVLMGVTAIVIVILFIGMVTQPAMTRSNENAMTVSLNQQGAYNKYIAKQPLNASDQLSNAFESWYINNESTNHYKDGLIANFHMNSNLSIFSKMNNNEKLNIVNKFLRQNPVASMELSKLLLKKENSFKEQNPMSMSMYTYVAERGNKTVTSSKTYQVNNENYTVSKVVYSMEINGSIYHESASIVQAPKGMKLIDPTVMVQINYLSQSFGWFGTLTFGEVDFIYENYMYNAYPEVGYNYNEAYQLVHTFLIFATVGGGTAAVLTAVIGTAAAAIGDLGTISSLGTAAYEISDLAYAYGEINLAYSSDSNSLPIVIQNDYIYDSYAGALTGNGWGMQVYVDNVGWQQALYPLVFSGLDSPGLSSFAHNFQSKYSSNWHWVGLYTGS